jgi:hypothetical protein
MPKKATKEKPLLHRHNQVNDPGLYNADLDWYFTAYDYECGLKSVGIGDALDLAFMAGSYTMVDEHATPMKVAAPAGGNAPRDPYTDHHVNYGNTGVFTKGRRIWQRITALPWHVQEMLSAIYTPRNYYAPGFKPLAEDTIRWAHQQYYLARTS